MALTITIDREAIDLAVRFLQSASIPRLRLTVAGGGYGTLKLADLAGGQSVTLVGRSGTPAAGACDVQTATVRRVLDAIPSYENNVTLYASALVNTTVADPVAPSGYVTVATPAVIRFTFTGNVASLDDPSITAA